MSVNKDSTEKLYTIVVEKFSNDINQTAIIIGEIKKISVETAKNELNNLPLILIESATEDEISTIRDKLRDTGIKTVISAQNAPKTNYNKTSSNINNFKKSKNKKGIENTIEVVGAIVLIVGLISSIALGLSLHSLIAFVASSFATIAISFSFFGFAKIINLLDEIVSQLKNISNRKK